MAQVLVAVAFTVVHPVAEMAKPSGINSLGKRKKNNQLFFFCCFYEKSEESETAERI